MRHRIIDELLLKQYPEESFSVDWEQDGKTYSLAIFNPETKILLAVFELKVSSPYVFSTEGIRKVIEKYRTLTTDPKVPLYVVSSMQGKESFSVRKILYQTKNSNVPHFIEVDELPNFNELKKKVLDSTVNNDFTKMTDEELEGIIRLHENPDVPGSRFQRAITELDLRYKKRNYQPTVHFEVGGNMNGNQIILGDKNSATKKSLVAKNVKIVNRSKKENLFSKYLWPSIFTVVAGVVIFIINEGKIPKLFSIGSKDAVITSSSHNVVIDRLNTTTPNLSDIFDKASSMGTSLEKQNLFAKYKDSVVYGYGSFIDIGTRDDQYLVAVDVAGGGKILCFFNKNLENRLLLFKRNQVIDFSGIFRVYVDITTPSRWVVDDCSFLN